MKKILLIAVGCISIGLLQSCSADDQAESIQTISTEDTGGQHGYPKPPPPPPPPPPTNSN